MFLFRFEGLSTFVKEFRNNITASRNLESFFKIFFVPSDDTFRYALKTVTTFCINELLRKIQGRLERKKKLKPLLFQNKYYLVALDGTGLSTSKKIKYKNAITRKKDDEILYMHYAINAVLTDQNGSTALPLAYEPVTNGDKKEFFVKNDCELNGAKRLLPKMKKMYPKRGFCFLGDNLYAVKPFLKMVLGSSWHFIITAKEDRNVELFRHYNTLKDTSNTFEYTDDSDNRNVYRWENALPLTVEFQTENYFYVNFVEYWQYHKNGNQIFHSTWITDFSINIDNVKDIAKAGRARFAAVENRTFNKQKSLGYGLDHNYGHEGNLPSVFFGLLQVAHIITELFSKWKIGRKLIKKVGSEKRFFERLGALLSAIVLPEHPLPLLYVVFQWDTS